MSFEFIILIHHWQTPSITTAANGRQRMTSHVNRPLSPPRMCLFISDPPIHPVILFFPLLSLFAPPHSLPFSPTLSHFLIYQPVASLPCLALLVNQFHPFVLFCSVLVFLFVVLLR